MRPPFFIACLRKAERVAPFRTYPGRQMHHTLRYGRHGLRKVVVYGEASEAENASSKPVSESSRGAIFRCSSGHLP